MSDPNQDLQRIQLVLLRVASIFGSAAAKVAEATLKLFHQIQNPSAQQAERVRVRVDNSLNKFYQQNTLLKRRQSNNGSDRMTGGPDDPSGNPRQRL